VPLLVAKTTLIRARVTGTPGTTTNEGVVDREVKGVEIEAVEVAEAKAIQEVIRPETNYMTIETRSKRIIRRINCQLISVPFAARRATIRPIVICTKSFKRK
jgi:hypothetical protein